MPEKLEAMSRKYGPLRDEFEHGAVPNSIRNTEAKTSVVFAKRAGKMVSEPEFNAYSKECDLCGLIRGVIREGLGVVVCEFCYQQELVLA